MIKDLLSQTQQRMSKTVEVLRVDLTKIRTGRANTGLLDHLQVEYYGSLVSVSQVANVSVRDHRSLTLQIWEKDMVKSIEKALINSDLGLTPNTVGQTIHINLPPLTEERRKELVKVVKSEGESAKVAVRNIRRDANQQLKNWVQSKEISEDDERRAETDIQKITDQNSEKIDKVLIEKEKELMEI